ncbi:MAG TPA: glutamate--tRNA ligase [Steroidobacteraceae bacterium]
MSDAIVTRFAPSPTGALHPGNARTALFSFLLARQAGGRFILRIEDTDRERGSDDFIAAQLSDLAWLGIEWDAGPDRVDARGPYRQSERSSIYDGLFERLEREGRAYPCFCTPAELDIARKTQLAAGEPPRYPGTCRALDAAGRAAQVAAGRLPGLRFAIPGPELIRFDDLVRGAQAVEAATLGDFLVRRADGGAMFFFSNAVDDALMGVTQVLRGDDHLSNTPRQLLVLRALGLTAPRYGHLPLLLDAGGAPQSKRRGSVTVGELRRQGYLASAIGNYLLRLGHHGAPDAWIEPADFARNFHADRLGRAPAHFDALQLDHWQREAVRRLDLEGAAAWLAPEFPANWPDSLRRAAAGLLQGNVLLPRDAREWVAVLSGELPPLAPDARDAIAEAGPAFFDAALASFAETGADLRALADRLKARTGRKGASLYMPLRFALTGRHDGPELAALLAAIPAALVRDRLAGAARTKGA